MLGLEAGDTVDLSLADGSRVSVHLVWARPRKARISIEAPTGVRIARRPS